MGTFTLKSTFNEKIGTMRLFSDIYFNIENSIFFIRSGTQDTLNLSGLALFPEWYSQSFMPTPPPFRYVVVDNVSGDFVKLKQRESSRKGSEVKCTSLHSRYSYTIVSNDIFESLDIRFDYSLQGMQFKWLIFLYLL